MKEYYHSIERNSSAECKDKGSRFIGYAFPVQTIHESKVYLEETKTLHPKASHHCFAYRIETAHETFRMHDDGEPAGAAGRPILGQIDSRGLTNTLVVVVRYFGGTLLGIPGLIQAYKSAAAACLDHNRIIRKNITVPYTLRFAYARMNDIMRILKRHDVSITKKETGLDCQFSVDVPMKEMDMVKKQLLDVPGTVLQDAL